MPRVTSNWPSSSLVQPLSLTLDLPGVLKSSLLFLFYEFRLALSPDYCNACFLALLSEMKFLQKIVI